jgi:hypothetical protein
LATISDDQATRWTREWVNKVVVGLNFCPFAAREVTAESIRYSVCRVVDLRGALEQFAEEVQYLDAHRRVEMTLLVFPDRYDDFDDFLDLIELTDQLIDDMGWRGTYQLAHFHPAYVFEGEDPDASSNYTNRSPLPVLHLLRESSVARAVATSVSTADIPANNAEVTAKLGVDALAALVASCRSDS